MSELRIFISNECIALSSEPRAGNPETSSYSFGSKASLFLKKAGRIALESEEGREREGGRVMRE